MATPDKSQRRSVNEIVRLPEAFVVVLLTVALVLLLSPYLSGADFGIFKIPSFPAATTRALKLLGPVVFLLTLFLFIPIWRPAGASAETQLPERPETQALRAVPGGIRVRLASLESVPDLVGRAISRYVGRRRAAKPYFSNLATVVAELALNAFEHGGASYVDVGLYKYSVVLQDDGAAFNPLQFKRQDNATGGAGLFALNDLLQYARPPIAPDYRSFDDSFRGVRNELVLYLLDLDPPGEQSAAMFNIRLRTRTDQDDLEGDNLAHVVELRWGFRHYVLSPDAVYEQTYVMRIISRERNLVELVIKRIPPDAVLHVRVKEDDMDSRYYSWLAQRYPGRLLVEPK